VHPACLNKPRFAQGQGLHKEPWQCHPHSRCGIGGIASRRAGKGMCACACVHVCMRVHVCSCLHARVCVALYLRVCMRTCESRAWEGWHGFAADTDIWPWPCHTNYTVWPHCGKHCLRQGPGRPGRLATEQLACLPLQPLAPLTPALFSEMQLLHHKRLRAANVPPQTAAPRPQPTL